MPRYIAFLRAINVGGHHTVKMDFLRCLFESLGFSNVETFIASGNVVFGATSNSAQALARKIEERLREALDMSGTFIRSGTDGGHRELQASQSDLDGPRLEIASRGS